jgi:hypothetical protein
MVLSTCGGGDPLRGVPMWHGWGKAPWTVDVIMYFVHIEDAHDDDMRHIHLCVQSLWIPRGLVVVSEDWGAIRLICPCPHPASWVGTWTGHLAQLNTLSLKCTQLENLSPDICIKHTETKSQNSIFTNRKLFLIYVVKGDWKHYFQIDCAT